MGRALKTAEVIDVPVIDEGAVRHDLVVLDQAQALKSQHDATVRAVALRVGYLLPGDSADPDLIQRDIAANLRRSVESCLEVGRALMVLKEACAHGEFMARLDVLGVEPRLAQRFMQASLKFSNASSTTLLRAASTQTKLFELLVLDDEQVAELELTGQTGELELDKVASMSVKELRAAVRESREQRKATDALLAAKDRKINELAVDSAAKPVVRPWAESCRQLRQELGAHFDLLDEGAARLATLIVAVAEGDFGDAEDPEGAEQMRRSLAVILGDRLTRLSQVVAAAYHRYDGTLSAWAEELDNQGIPARDGAEG